MPELHPALVLLVTALAVALAPRRLGGPLTLLGGSIALGAVAMLPTGTRWAWDFYGFELTVLRVDDLARPFALAFAVITVAVGLYGWSIMGTLERAAAVATAAAGLGVVLAGDLLTMLLFWELKVTTAALVILSRRSRRSSAAARRYLGVHLASGAVLMAGLWWWLASGGSLALDELGLSAASSLVLVGVLVSAAAVPFHAWLPDAYPEATIAGTVALSAFTTKSAVYVLARAFPGVELLVWLGITMALVGVVFAVLEDEIRRLLSYHIVSQVGFMVAAIGVGTAAAVNGATAHATAHVLYKGLLLMAVGAVVYATGVSRASQLGGLAPRQRWVVTLYLVGAASIAGVPLFSGFPAKELAVASISDGGFSAAAWALKLASVGTFASVVIKLPVLTWFGNARSSAAADPACGVPVTMYAGMAVIAALNVTLGVRPDLLYGLLPSGVDFQPYTTAKVTEALMLCTFTALAMVLLRARWAPVAKESLDTDWLYRELPARTLPAARRKLDPTGARLATLRSRPSRVGLGSLSDRMSHSGPVAPSWLLGSTLAAAMVLILLVSVAT
jgi:multicomponent Na+:H+ antiporter subunit D